MLYLFGFDRVGVAAADLYLAGAGPAGLAEGAARGVRVEVRVLSRGGLGGSVHSAQPILVGRPVWRADLLESAAGPPGSLDRARCYRAFAGWEPDARVPGAELPADPFGWLAAQLADLDGLLAGAGCAARTAGQADADDVRRAVPEITAAVRRLLGRAGSAELGTPPLVVVPAPAGRGDAELWRALR